MCYLKLVLLLIFYVFRSLILFKKFKFDISERTKSQIQPIILYSSLQTLVCPLIWQVFFYELRKNKFLFVFWSRCSNHKEFRVVNCYWISNGGGSNMLFGFRCPPAPCTSGLSAKHGHLRARKRNGSAAAKFPKSQCLLCGEVGWSGWWGGVIFPGATARKMASLDKLCIVHHPEGAKVVFIAHKTLVQWQIGADRVLYTQTTKKEKKRVKDKV